MAGQTSTLDRHDGTSWMSRGREVLAHLRVVADEVEYVMVEASGASTDATVSILSTSPEELMLHLGGSAMLPGAAPGIVVKVTYNHNEASYEFLSVVTGREEYGRVKVALPRVVERQERRAARRLNVFTKGTIKLQTDWGGQLKVFDISTSGLGVVGTREDVRRALADGIRGVLTLTDDIRLNVWLDVRHSRKLNVPGKMLIGARFLGLPSRDISVIRNYVDARLQ